MSDVHVSRLELFWRSVLEGDGASVGALLIPGGAWDDPLFDGARGAAVLEAAIPRFNAWFQARTEGGGVAHLRTTSYDRRVCVESVVDLRDGLTWNQALQKSEPAERFQLAVAVVGDRGPEGRFLALRTYFGTWSVLDGHPRMRVGPVAPDERDRAREALDHMPVLRRYFDLLAHGQPGMADLFEPDGYFREPASNFACGRDQLLGHFSHILALGGVGIEHLTATRERDRIALELQTVVWGTKRMPCPQAGFAVYDLGTHGRIVGARVYDSVVPPTFD